VTFEVPPELREDFAFRAGQHLTVRRVVKGEDVRRSYSICSTPAELASTGRLRIGVKAVSGGAFSQFATRELGAGHTVDVMPPLGHFTSEFASERTRHYVAVAAGSGITPILSLIATALATEPASTFTLVYGNRYARSVMFAEELADLKDRFPTRLQLVHVLSREPQDADVLSGRVDARRFARLVETGLVNAEADEWFLCGPYAMVMDVRNALADRGVVDSAVHTELFHVEDTPSGPRTETVAGEAPKVDGAAVDGAAVTIVLDGRASSFTMRRDERVLDAALKIRAELPYACKGGVCSTCRAKVTVGRVEMARNYALEPDEVAAGYVLTCQASPVTEEVTVDYDA
jgi:ring-1,2-phenylacetyl-CoA epoxidase subunit PaaE